MDNKEKIKAAEYVSIAAMVISGIVCYISFLNYDYKTFVFFAVIFLISFMVKICCNSAYKKEDYHEGHINVPQQDQDSLRARVDQEKTPQTGNPTIKQDDTDDLFLENEYYRSNYINRMLDEKKLMITKRLLRKDYEGAISIVADAIAESDDDKDAVDVHFFLASVIDDFYALREEDALSLHYCMAICERDIQRYDLFAQQADYVGQSIDYISPTRMAIILEKLGYYEEAIQLCDWAIERNLWDNGKKSFLNRRMRLITKMKKDGVDNGEF